MKSANIVCLIISLSFIVESALGQDYRNISISNEKERFEAVIILKQKEIKANSNKIYAWYSLDGLQATQGAFKGKLLHGSFSRYDLKQHLLESGQYRYGLRHGDWKHWDDNGSLLMMERWCMGERHGLYKIYDSEGNLAEKGVYRKGEIRKKQLISADEISSEERKKLNRKKNKTEEKSSKLKNN